MQDIITDYITKGIFAVIRHWKTVLFFTIIGVICVALYSLIQNFALITVEVDKTHIDKSLTVSTYANSIEESKKIGSEGFQIIPRNTKSITVSAGDSIKTQSLITIPWYGIFTKKITLWPDKNADKVAYTSTLPQPCATYNQDLDQLLAYSCQLPAALTKYDTPSNSYWGADIISTLAYVRTQAAPYKGGLIGISTTLDSPAKIISYDGKGGSHSFDPPPFIDTSQFNQAVIRTDEADPNSSMFVIVTSNGDIYRATIDDQKNINYKLFPAPQGYSSTFQKTLCRVVSSQIHCIRVNNQVGDVKTPKNAPQPTVITASIDSESFASTPIDIDYLDDFVATADGRFYVTDNKKLFFLSKETASYSPVEIAQNVDSIFGGKNLFIIQQNGVFTSDKTDLRQIFYSPNLLLKSLSIYNDIVFVLASVKDRPGETFAYRLNAIENTTPNHRIIDLYPTSSDKLSSLRFQDMVGNRIYGVTRETSDIVNDFPTIEQEVRVNLQSLGIETNNFDIRIVY